MLLLEAIQIITFLRNNDASSHGVYWWVEIWIMGFLNYAFTCNPLRCQLDIFIEALCSEITNKIKAPISNWLLPWSTFWSSFTAIDVFHRKKNYVKPINNTRTRMFWYYADKQTVSHLPWCWEHFWNIISIHDLYYIICRFICC